jgi:hypothetical protein
MKPFRFTIALTFLMAVLALGIIPRAYAQTANKKCNCMVFQPGQPGQYGVRPTLPDPCTVQTCFIMF